MTNYDAARVAIEKCEAQILAAINGLIDDLESDELIRLVYDQERLERFTRPAIVAARTRLTRKERMTLADVSIHSDYNWRGYLKGKGL